MNLIQQITSFIRENFDSDILDIDEFKPGTLVYIYIKCINENNAQVQIQLQKDRIGISKVEIIQTQADFSLPDVVFTDITRVEEFILELKRTSTWPL